MKKVGRSKPNSEAGNGKLDGFILYEVSTFRVLLHQCKAQRCAFVLQ